MITETNQIMKMIKCCSLERGDLSRYLIETNGKMECIYLNFIIKDHFRAIGMSAKIEKMRHTVFAVLSAHARLFRNLVFRCAFIRDAR